MSALHLTARRQTGRTHVCTGITESVASKYIILSLPLSRSLSFTLSRYHTAHNHSMFLPVPLSSAFLQSLPLCFFSLSFTIITNYFPYNPSICFFFHSFFFFFFSFRPSFIEKKIEKDFVVAASKCNEMLSLPSIHKFVLHFELIFFFCLFYIGLCRFYTEQNYLLQKFR